MNTDSTSAVNDGFPESPHARNDVYSGVYERHYSINPGDVVYDLGANVGHFTEMAVAKVGPTGALYAFEPENRNFSELERRCGHHTNVVMHRAAALHSEGPCSLYLNRLNCGGHSLLDWGVFHETQPCKGIDIGRYITSRDAKPSFIKIDTEGSEVEILRSLIQNGISCPMAIECHNHDLYKECVELATSAALRWIDGDSPVGVNYIMP